MINNEFLKVRFYDLLATLRLTVGGTLRALPVQGDFRIHPIKVI